MRRLATTLSITLAAACGQPAPGTQPAPHAPAASKAFTGPLPDIAVESLEGHVESLRDVTKGKVVVIDLWATWCGACREVSARAAELAKSETNPDFMVVGLDQGEERDTVTDFLGTAKHPYPIYIDHQFDMSTEIGLEAIPAIIVVDRTGRVRHVSKKLDATTVRVVSELLAEKPASAAP